MISLRHNTINRQQRHYFRLFKTEIWSPQGSRWWEWWVKVLAGSGSRVLAAPSITWYHHTFTTTTNVIYQVLLSMLTFQQWVSCLCQIQSSQNCYDCTVKCKGLMRWSNGFLSSFNWRELKSGVLSRTPNVIQARPRGYPEQNTALLLHPAITWMQSAFYLLLTLTHTEIIFKDPLLASKIGWFYKVFWLYICLYVYIQWYYTNQLTLPSTLVFQSASPILTCFLCMAQKVLST